jgi:hypothetical protein
MMANDILCALAIGNALIITAGTAISLMPFVPLPLDIALGTVAASTLTVTGWLATFTSRALLQTRKDVTT